MFFFQKETAIHVLVEANRAIYYCSTQNKTATHASRSLAGLQKPKPLVYFNPLSAEDWADYLHPEIVFRYWHTLAVLLAIDVLWLGFVISAKLRHDDELRNDMSEYLLERLESPWMQDLMVATCELDHEEVKQAAISNECGPVMRRRRCR